MNKYTTYMLQFNYTTHLFINQYICCKKCYIFIGDIYDVLYRQVTIYKRKKKYYTKRKKYDKLMLGDKNGYKRKF